MGKIKNDSQGRKRNPYKGSVVIFITLLLILFGGSLAFGALDKEPNKQVLEKAFKIQMPFIANEGQISDEHVRFYAKTFGGTVFVTDQGEMVFSFSMSEPKPALSRLNPRDKHLKPEGIKVWTLREKLIGSLETMPKALDKAETKVNYFMGNDKNKWKTNITTHNEVSLGEVYKGIDLKLKAYGKNVEKIFTVKPGAEATAIELKIDGANSLKINEKGELEIETELGTAMYSKPLAHQVISGKRVEVEANYQVFASNPSPQTSELGLHDSTLETQHSSLAYGFKVGDYDKSSPLIIDPVLLFSTYLGGSNDDLTHKIAVDIFGNIYIVGETLSANFPTQNPIQSNNAGNLDVFVTKIGASYSAVVYSTYLGGSNYESGESIAVDGKGNAYITGWTDSEDFPTQNPIQGSLGGGLADAFVVKIEDPGGPSLVYSTYLGGSGYDVGLSIAVDGDGNAYITGWTDSEDFPTQNPIQGYAAGWDIFVTKININPSGSDLLYSTYLGGSGLDEGRGIAVDGAGNAYITGYTSSPGLCENGYPTVWCRPYYVGGADAFVATINPDGSIGPFFTYWGGSGTDIGDSIAVSGSNIYITGSTTSTDFWVSKSTPHGGNADAFVSIINAFGPLYSTYLGGSGDDVGYGIAVDGSGNAYITGVTHSPNFPVTADAVQSTFGGVGDAFLAKVDRPCISENILYPNVSCITYSTYLGGSQNDGALGIALDISGSIYITGPALSADFPKANPIQATYAGGSSFGDAFVAKFSGPLIDHTKWANLEFIRRTEGDGLRSALRWFGENATNSLGLKTPSGVNSIQADVTINAFINKVAFPRARIGGYFYRDTNIYGVPGDIFAEVGIGEFIDGGLHGYYLITRCFNFDCTLNESFAFDDTLQSVNLHSNYALSIDYDQTYHKFIFSVGGATAEFSPTRPWVSPPNNQWKGISTRISNTGGDPTKGGYVDARFENVFVNGVPKAISDSNGMIDHNNWSDSTLEFVREQINDGVYGLALRSYGSYDNNGLNFINAPDIKELQADITVKDLINDGSVPQARIYGTFYNDGTSGDPAIGDIHAAVGIRHNGTQPIGFYVISKCTAPDCNLAGEFTILYYYEDPATIGLDLTRPHRVSIRCDDSDPSNPKFTFGFDGRLTTPNVTLPPKVGSPKSHWKGIHTRLFGSSGGSYVSARFANVVTVADMDGDEVPDRIDNSPTVYDRDQKDTDGDGVGDAYDNCPAVYNPIEASWVDKNGVTHYNSQRDFDLDGLGDICDGTSSLTLPASIPPSEPGAPIWVQSCFFNGTGQPITTIIPDCYNTFFAVTDSSGNLLPPTCRIPAAYGIPDDTTTIQAGAPPFCVTCDLSEMYLPEVLAANPDNTSKNYTVVSTYSNYIQDPDLGKPNCYDPSGPAVPGGIPCYNLWTGAISSTPTSVTISGQAVQKKTAQVIFDPFSWSANWATIIGPPISAHISMIQDHDVSDVDASTIRLNGTVPITGTASVSSGVLTVEFDRSLAVQSLGSVVLGQTFYPVVQGGFTNSNNDIFSGKGLVIIGYYSFSGFFSPVDNPPVVNVAKAGQTVPIKWRITDANGTGISDSGSFSSLKSYPVSCDGFSGNPEEAVVASTPGASGLQYLANGNWQYNWKTSKTAGCRTMVLTLADGTQFTAMFKFK
jgi:hypothetical protein